MMVIAQAVRCDQINTASIGGLSHPLKSFANRVVALSVLFPIILPEISAKQTVVCLQSFFTRHPSLFLGAVPVIAALVAMVNQDP